MRNFRIDSPRVADAEYPDPGSSAEIYANADRNAYVELELLGPLRVMKPGDQTEGTSIYTPTFREEPHRGGAEDSSTKAVRITERAIAISVGSRNIVPVMGTKNPHIVVLGAGFGGLTFCQKFYHPEARVTVVDRQNHHL